MKKGLEIVKNIIIFAYILVVLLVTICLLSYNDYKLTVFGDNTLVPVIDDDLEPTYSVGDLLIIKKNPIEDVKVGDTVFFYRTRSGETVINIAKVVDLEKLTESETTFTIDGKFRFSSTNFVGKTDTATVIPKLGLILGTLESKWGFLFLGVFPSLLVFLYTLYSVVLEFYDVKEKEAKKAAKKKSSKKKKKTYDEEDDDSNDEIEKTDEEKVLDKETEKVEETNSTNPLNEIDDNVDEELEKPKERLDKKKEETEEKTDEINSLDSELNSDIENLKSIFGNPAKNDVEQEETTDNEETEAVNDDEIEIEGNEENVEEEKEQEDTKETEENEEDNEEDNEGIVFDESHKNEPDSDEEETEPVKEEKKELTAEEKRTLIEEKMKTLTPEQKKALIEAKLKSMTPEQKRALIEAKKKKLEEQNNGDE